jgi:Rps23 Pro-64 3,4-dihydroxylase Tpa1-like proline 4-hydroxylase
MKIEDFVNLKYRDPNLFSENYAGSKPYSNIVFENFFNREILDQVSEDFPDLEESGTVARNSEKEIKLGCSDPSRFPKSIYELTSFLNSREFLEYLQDLTGIKETLISDPYFAGGGLHEIKPGGLLKIHADYNYHPKLNLDRRVNLLVYLNKDWDDSYGGEFEMWDAGMSKAEKKVKPIFNTVAIFNTTSYTYHGHPDPLTCPAERSRRSIALYYFSTGRPASETRGEKHSTIFVEREGEEFKKMKAKVFRKFASKILPQRWKNFLNR